MRLRSLLLPLTAGALTLAAAAPPAVAGDVKAGDLVIARPWARATPGGASVAGGYLTVTNRGAVADRLTGGSLEAATGFALHAMAMNGAVMTMRPTGPLTIPPGGTLTLSPGGTHIMFTGLTHGLARGTTVSGTLVFDHAGTVPVQFAVEAIGAKAPAMPGMAMP